MLGYFQSKSPPKLDSQLKVTFSHGYDGRFIHQPGRATPTVPLNECIDKLVDYLGTGNLPLYGDTCPINGPAASSLGLDLAINWGRSRRLPQ